MKRKQKAAIARITGHPRYAGLKAALPVVLMKFPRAVIGVYDLGYKVWIMPKRWHSPIELASNGGWTVSEIRVLDNPAAIERLLDASVREGSQK